MEAAAAIEHRRQEPRKQGFCRKRFILGCYSLGENSHRGGKSAEQKAQECGRNFCG